MKSFPEKNTFIYQKEQTLMPKCFNYKNWTSENAKYSTVEQLISIPEHCKS
jgi:hypothetical protein